MGILNVTPDSFSDGGSYIDLRAAVDRAYEMAGQGADIIDVGGESTRPGSDEVSVEVELARVVPVIARLADGLDLPLSIDTRHAEVARAALDAGAVIINNVMPIAADEAIAGLAAESGAGLVVMHMRGSPRTMNSLASYDDVVEDVLRMLRESVEFALKHGVARDQIVVDPGIGFAKDTRHNLKLIAGLERLCELAPVLAGASRKRFIAELCNESDALERTGGSVGAAVMSVLHGAAVVRVHDVKESVQALTVVNAVREFERVD
jgi:dihydropteroate synthase